MTAQLLQDDCLEALPTLATDSVDMVLADLPYGTTRNAWDSVIDLDRLWPELWRVLKPNGAAVLTSQGRFTLQLGMSQIEHFKYKDVWVKSKATGFLNVRKQPLRKHEDVCVFYREQCTYNPQRGPGDGYDKGVRTKQTDSYGHMKGARIKSEGGRAATDVVYFQTAEHEPGGIPLTHATQKPIALGSYLVNTYTDPGEVVLDVCFGSGAFLVAAIREGRRAIGIELDAKQFAVGRAEILLARAQPRLFATVEAPSVARQERLL